MTAIRKTYNSIFEEQSNAPLIVFRILFGALMLFSTIRFWYYGWIEAFYIDPVMHFKYYGLEWVKVLPPLGMYILFATAAIAALFIMLGFLYRIATVAFFLSFTYIELIDKTYYLNHYYFVSLVALILIFLPANQRLSLDTKLVVASRSNACQKWQTGIIKFQLAIVYVFAGIAKIHPDWLLQAQPLQNWLHTNHHLPIVGPILKYKTTAFLLSWGGMLYDLFIVFFLMNKRTRFLAYGCVVFFHVFTWILFPIGVFPWVMIASTLIFFGAGFHERILGFFEQPITIQNKIGNSLRYKKIVSTILSLYVLFQVTFPFRFAFYEGDLFWKEQGYRFSWRVMLMEKAGHATFYVEDQNTGGRITIDNSQYLSPIQEKMMATQPDFILEYAQYLEKEYSGKIIVINGEPYTIRAPKVFADIYVTVNGSGSKPYVSNTLDLASIPNNLSERTWVNEYH